MLDIYSNVMGILGLISSPGHRLFMIESQSEFIGIYSLNGFVAVVLGDNSIDRNLQPLNLKKGDFTVDTNNLYDKELNNKIANLTKKTMSNKELIKSDYDFINYLVKKMEN